MKELYSNIEVCPWCGVKPSICISQHKKTVMFDIMVGCTNEDCRFNPKCYSTCTCNGLNRFISDMIAEWNSRCCDIISNPPNIEFVIDTESKWSLSESLEEENKCADCKHYWYCTGEECCNLDEPSFPESCDKFEQEGSE